MRLVMVEWEDSSAPAGWECDPSDSEDKALLCRSVGWLAMDGEHVKVLAAHVHSEDDPANFQGAGVMRIPTRCIVSLRDLLEVYAD